MDSGRSVAVSKAQHATTSNLTVQKSVVPSQKDLELEVEAALFAELAAEAAVLEKQAKLARACPVPKPTGWLGRVLGFEDQKQKGKTIDRPARGEKG